jgi:hypothetical protein
MVFARGFFYFRRKQLYPGQVPKSSLGTLDFEFTCKETQKLVRQCQRTFKERLTDTALGGVEE